MNADDLLLALETTLTEPLRDRGLELSILGTEEDALELLCLDAVSGRVVLIAGEIMLGDDGDSQASGAAEVTLRFLIQIPRGMEFRPGDVLYKARERNAPPLLVLTKELRGLVARCLAPARTDFDNQFGFRFQADRPYAPQGELGLRAREVTFRVTVALDMPNDGEAFDLFET